MVCVNRYSSSGNNSGVTFVRTTISRDAKKADVRKFSWLARKRGRRDAILRLAKNSGLNYSVNRLLFQLEFP